MAYLAFIVWEAASDQVVGSSCEYVWAWFVQCSAAALYQSAVPPEMRVFVFGADALRTHLDASP